MGESWAIWIFGTLITIGLFAIGYLQTRNAQQQERNAQQQERRLAAIEGHLDSLGKFKDEVLKGYLTKNEHNYHRDECIGKFAEIFQRLHDLEVK